MPIITLTDLSLLVSATPFAADVDIEQEQLQLLIKQTCLKLPTEPLLDIHPQMDRWVMEISWLFPEVFEWKPPQWLVDTQLSAPLDVGNKKVWVQINTNAAFLEPQSVHLIEWAIRHPVLKWSDRVKLWVAAASLSLPPENLKLTILALHPTHAAQRHEISWDSQQQIETRDWLESVLKEPTATQKPPVGSPEVSLSVAATLTDINLDEIQEVEI